MQNQTPGVKRVCIRTAALVATLLMVQPIVSLAFKPITHVWIAQQVLNDLDRLGNKVEIDGREYMVDGDIADAIRLNAGAFRMGYIGPDAFPDVLVGQMAIHPGNPENPEGMDADEWLKELLENSSCPASRAFAYGYIGHAATDMFAHTYVNTYAGDAFEIRENKPKQEQKPRREWQERIKDLLDRIRKTPKIPRFGDEEKRHVMLEGFIEKFTPPIRDHRGGVVHPRNLLTVPQHEVANFFFRSPSALKGYDDRWFTWHLIVMAEHRRNVAELKISANSPALVADLSSLKIARDQEESEIARLVNQKTSLPPDVKKQLKDRRTYLKAINQLIKQLDERVADCADCVEKWLMEIDGAIDGYIEMSGKVAIELTRKDGDPIKHVKDWIKFEAPRLFRSRYAEPVLKIQHTLEELKKKPVISTGVAIKELVDRIATRLRERIAVATTGVLLGKANRAMLKAVYFPEEIRDEDLDEVFKKPGTKKLLSIPDMAARARFDMGIPPKGEQDFIPENFAAVKHSITLAKLSLVGPDELNRLVRNYIPGSADVFLKDETPFNILFSAVRSIDGDHQWSEYAPPYFRSDGSTCNQPPRSYGYPQTDKTGFKLWSSENLRSRVFNRLFGAMIAPAVYAPQPPVTRLELPDCYLRIYHPTVEDPFPVINMAERASTSHLISGSAQGLD